MHETLEGVQELSTEAVQANPEGTRIVALRSNRHTNGAMLMCFEESLRVLIGTRQGSYIPQLISDRRKIEMFSILFSDVNRRVPLPQGHFA